MNYTQFPIEKDKKVKPLSSYMEDSVDAKSLTNAP